MDRRVEDARSKKGRKGERKGKEDERNKEVGKGGRNVEVER